MAAIARPWDYLIVTASNERQAAAYEGQLALRRELGLLTGIRQSLVVADPGGQRIGSGGSTILCLVEILNRELRARGLDAADRGAWADVLADLRVLIMHAGGDSRRLPAYGPCGKVFVPVPGETDTALGATLFDRQLPTYVGLPSLEGTAGQVVVTSGDVLLGFDPHAVRFAPEGVAALGCLAAPEQAARHGVFCRHGDGRVRLFLQKPSPARQAEHQAVNRYGQSILDIGVFNFAAPAAVALLEMCDVKPDADGRLGWTGEMGQAIETCGLDLYREIACAMGTDASATHLSAAARASGSTWSDSLLGRIFQTLSGLPFGVQVLSQCSFLHFGATRQIIASGIDLLRRDRGVAQLADCVSVNNIVAGEGKLIGHDAWVEGSRIRAGVTLGGRNVLVGVDVDELLILPPEACLDVVPGRDRDGQAVWFVRCYGVDDTFKESAEAGGTLCGLALADWLDAVGAKGQDVWDPSLPPDQWNLWNARVVPAESDPLGYRRWLWMFDPTAAAREDFAEFLAADRYSAAEIAHLADQDAFYRRRAEIRADEIRRSLRRMFRLESGLSAAELAYVLSISDDPAAWVAELLGEAEWYFGANNAEARLESFTYSRVIHTLGSAVAKLAGSGDVPLTQLLPGLLSALPPATAEWLDSLGLSIARETPAAVWAERARASAFRQFGKVIVSSGVRRAAPPVCTLRSDEIVWGRAPARLDLGGGWSDTPPYCLEQGGCVLNAAVDLNGQPPIHVYARLTEEPIIRIGSIDLGTRMEIVELDDLLDLHSATSSFALAKTALLLTGFSPEYAAWPEGVTLADMLRSFGGGIDLTTLAAIPKGSGLGTSSIVGAVLLAVVQRMVGRTLTQKDLFHGVLRLEQLLTTGGGWQDQIGGAVDGVKVATSGPGLVPDVSIHYVTPDVLEPALNGGATLLYYTGITRLAKNILQQVVGRYLDRDRAAVATIRQIHELPPHVAEAMARKDLDAFGKLIDAAWRLNKQLDPNSSTPEIEALLDRIRPHIHGAKLLGAGGGGFLLMVCKSAKDAQAVRDMLQADPLNDRARFFDLSVSREGLVITTC